ncbi:MAG: YwaF family protein [Clostridia bacterium]|nr:YwaF family protein [Clostridia bacterium]
MIFYVIFAAVAALSIGAMLLTKVYKSTNPKVEKASRILVIVWMSISFLNLFLPDAFAMRTFDDRTLYLGGENIPFAILRWFSEVSMVVLPVAIFFKKDFFNKITAFFLLTVCIMSIASYYKYMEFYTSPNGAGIMKLRFFSAETQAFFINPVFRGIYFGVMKYLELMLIAFVSLRSLDTLLSFEGKKYVLKLLGVFALVLFSIIPIYVPQYLFKGYSLVGAGNLDNFEMGTFFHIVWIILVILEGVGLTLLFKKKSYEDRFIVVLVMAIALVMQYNQMFTGIGEITAHRMPFQLCNMAPLFIMVMLLTKNERVYHFTLVINSVGAVIAMALCDTTPYGVTYIMNIHYVAEHTNVILVPVLCATLGIFGKLKTKDVKDFIIGFTLYFLFILLLGGTFTGLKELTGNDYWNCNYLFIFNKEETMGILGFVGPMFDMKIKLFNFFTLSVIQLVVYVVFLAICTGVFFLLKLALNKSSEKYEKMQMQVEVNEDSSNG